jgi:ferric-dicitrate binding protein FerR (iron transport regulator)
MTDPTNFEKRTQEVLEESVGRLDGRTRSRLTQARHAALAQLEQPARHWWRSYVPAGAAAAVAVLAVVMWSGPGIDRQQAASASAADDLELLADADAPDFVDDGEDLEFYEWAAGEVES